MGVSTGELVRRLRETLPPYQQKRLTHWRCPGPGARRTSSTGRCGPEALREILGEDLDPAARLRGRERRRLDSGSRHLPLDRPARSSRVRGRSPTRASRSPSPTMTGWPSAGRSAPSSNRPSSSACRSPGSSTRSSACGSSRALPRGAPRLGRGCSGPPSSSSSAARRSASGHNQFVRLDTLAVGGGLSHLGRHRGLDARLCAGPARHPDPGAAHGRADRPAGDVREGDPSERALVPGRAPRHPVPVAHVARASRPPSTWPSSCATSATRWSSGRSRRWCIPVTG